MRIRLACLKVACGYYQSGTSRQIAIEHGLIEEKVDPMGSYDVLTRRGQNYLWAAFAPETADPNF